MYYPGNAGYDGQGQWQQPPPPASGPPPPPPPMSAEAAAAYKNYGYGNVAPRSGPNGGRGPNPPPGQQSMGHQPPGGQYPPAKRAKYDRNMQQPYAGTPPYQPYHPAAHQVPPPPGQYQAMPPTGQPYYPPPQPGHPAYPPAHASLPQQPYQYPAPMHQPMVPTYAQHPQPYQTHEAGGSGPPLAVALMRATPMAPVSRGAEKQKANNPPHYNANLPPPPPSSSAPPPPPPPEPGIPSGPKGLASLPVRPTTAALPPNPATPSSASTSMPPTPVIPTGPSAHKTTIKRDTRPLPPQSRHVKDSLRGTGADGPNRGTNASEGRGKGPPTGPARGGRGGGRGGRSGFDGHRGPNRPQHNQNSQHRRDDRFEQAQQNKEKGYKRTFSQTGPPANSPRGPANRPRRNSDAGSSNANIPTGPKRGQVSNARRRERTVEGSPAPSVANNKSLKRTLTDFRIESLEIPMLNWVWKAAPLSQILAQMNLKEKEENTVKEEEEAEEVTGDPAVEGKTEPTDSAQVTAGATVPATSGSDPEAPAPESAELQRSDSRPEKRKHARDEDEEEQEMERLHQAASEEIKDDIAYPVGKKVRSEKEPAIDAATVEPSEAAYVTQTAGVGESHEAHLADEEVSTSAISDVTNFDQNIPPSHEARPADTDNVSVTSDSSEEVADSIIANRPTGETREDRGSLTPIPDDDDEPLIIRDINTGDEVSHLEARKVEESNDGNAVKAERAATIKNVPKKFWENSRLRIYFMSPVELEQKDVRQNLIQQKRKTVESSKPAEEERKEEVESVETGAEEKPPVTTGEESVPDAETTEVQPESAQSDIKTKEGDDLDGEPLSAEEQAASVAAESEVDVNRASDVAEPQVSNHESGSAIAEVKKEEEELHQDISQDDVVEKNTRQLAHPSADRLSIAYAQNTRRLIVDAEVVDEVVLHRAEGKIEINLRIEMPTTEEEGKGFRCARGIYIEKSASSGEQGFEEISIDELRRCWDVEDETRPVGEALDEETTSSDHLSPPLHHLLANKSEPLEGDDAGEKESVQICTIVAKMDRAHPLTEAKWVRTGNADDWIQSVIGNGIQNSLNGNNKYGSAGGGGKAAQQLPKGEQGKNNNDTLPNAGGSAKNLLDVDDDKNVTRGSAWKGKIRVVDPDAPPTFQHALENWLSSANSRNGFDEARYKFVNTHFQDVNNVLEVLLRLIRGVGSVNVGGGNVTSSSTSSYNNNNNNYSVDSTYSQSNNLATQSKLLKAPYPDYQTPISLATFQIFRMAIDSSSVPNTNGNSNGTKKQQQQQQQQQDINRKIGEIIRNLPYSLIFKSLDSMFSDFKKGNLG